LEILRKYSTLIGFGAIVVVFSSLAPNFLTIGNIVNIFVQISMIAIIAFGATTLLVSGVFDLSIGALVSVTGLVAAVIMQRDHYIMLSVFLLPLMVGFAAGVLNGVMVGYGDIPPFIATIGTMTIFEGTSYAITKGGGGTAVSFYEWTSEDPNFLVQLVQGRDHIVPIPVVIMIAVFLIVHILLTQTRLGRHLAAIGANSDAAFASGINVKKGKLIAYIICGITAGISGLLLVGWLGSGQPEMGFTFMFDAIACIFIGTSVVKKGRVHVIGTFIGALVISVINNGSSLMGIQYGYQYFIKGAIILLAVITTSASIRSRLGAIRQY
jgi:ribose transport system permease protein